MKKIVAYFAHPLASDPPGNIEKAKVICRKIAEKYPNITPVSPLLAFSFCREPEDRELAMFFCRTLLPKCDELWMTGDWRKSKGCIEEMTLAISLGMPISEYKDGKVHHLTEKLRQGWDVVDIKREEENTKLWGVVEVVKQHIAFCCGYSRC
ncbi:MAG: hypothetical protein A4E53_01510 [Pelotomaculum sp. PtaB.Bin104]|nr:MAG: hypothetical protein A4E53_01510 [Pelotomaculum sp. PtaB.Bin104]